MPQRMPPELLATTPPTVAKSVLAGSGPSRRLYGARTRFAWPSAVPGRTRAARTVLLDLHAGEVAADVDQDPVALALAVQAGSPRAERHRDALLAAEAEHLRDIAGVTGLTTAFGKRR